MTEFEVALKEQASGASNTAARNTTMIQWGQEKEEELLNKERGHVIKNEDLTKNCRTARLAKTIKEGHSLAHPLGCKFVVPLLTR